MAFNRRSIHPITNWHSFLVAAKAEFEKLFSTTSKSNVKTSDFDFLKTLGMGAFGRVVLAKYKESNDYLAFKILPKSALVKTKQVKLCINEKKILQALNFPFTVYLEFAFHDNSYVYLCLPLINGGEMFTHLKKRQRFTERLSKFYGAQVLLGLEYLHYCDMVYRDLKPENIMVDNKGYVKITDFGFCKVIRTRTYTLCGTPEYIAPEIILNKPYGKAVDWWSYGVLLFEMSSGYPPFHGRDPMKIYEKIIDGKYKLPSYFSQELKDLIKNILQGDLSKRFGNLRNGVNDIKDHKWFRDIQWIALLNYKIEPEFIPIVKDVADINNFRSYDEIKLTVSKEDVYADEFRDF